MEGFHYRLGEGKASLNINQNSKLKKIVIFDYIKLKENFSMKMYHLKRKI